MSRSELHNWESSIESLCGDNADKILDIAQDIYKTAFVRGKYYISLEQEPCEDTISRQAVIDSIRNYFHDEYYQRTSIQDCRDCLIEDVIKPLSPVMPQPKTGHWIDTGSGQECSECGEIQHGYDNFRFYCAKCGSKNVIESEG